MSAQIINFSEARARKEMQIQIRKGNVEAKKNLDMCKLSPAQEYNYRFYQLVDLFMQQTYPGYTGKFAEWLKNLE